MKTPLLLILALFIFSISSAQNFEGKIQLVKKTLSDTSYLTYSIKGDQVRIDEYDKYKRLQRYFLVNIKDKSVFAINPAKKMFATMPSKTDHIPANDPNFKITKTDNYKNINGYKCYQWRVRNTKQNTEIAYWIAEENFEFFTELIKTWDNSEKNLSFYLLIPDSKGRMPMLAVERTLLRDEKIRLAVTDIDKEALDDSIFKIPPSFKNLQPRH